MSVGMFWFVANGDLDAEEPCCNTKYKSIFETFKTRLELLDSKLQVILYIKS